MKLASQKIAKNYDIILLTCGIKKQAYGVNIP